MKELISQISKIYYFVLIRLNISGSFSSSPKLKLKNLLFNVGSFEISLVSLKKFD